MQEQINQLRAEIEMLKRNQINVSFSPQTQKNFLNFAKKELPSILYGTTTPSNTAYLNNSLYVHNNGTTYTIYQLIEDTSGVKNWVIIK